MSRSRTVFVVLGMLAIGTLAACDTIPTATPAVQFSPNALAPSRWTSTLYPESPFGVVFAGNHLKNDDANRRAADLMRTAGVRAARVTAYWWYLQQLGDNSFNEAAMAELRSMINALLEVGIQPYVTLEGTACFARDLPRDCLEAKTAPKSAHWGAWETYVRQMVDSFPAVTHWGIWNEPQSHFLNPDQPWEDRLTTYKRLVERAAPIIRSRGDKVVGPDLGTGRDIGTNMEPREWLRQFMVSHGQYIDVVAVHLYGQLTSNDVRAGMNGYAQTLVQAGYPNKELWLTEVARGGANVTDAEQHANLDLVYEAMRWRSVPGWSKTFYNNAGVFDGPMDDFGLVRDLGTPWQQPRPAYYALKELTRLKATVSGPIWIGANELGHWRGGFSGGTPPYSYYFSIDNDVPISSNEMDLYRASQGSDFVVRFVVRDADGAQSVAALGVTAEPWAPYW